MLAAGNGSLLDYPTGNARVRAHKGICGCLGCERTGKSPAGAARRSSCRAGQRFTSILPLFSRAFTNHPKVLRGTRRAARACGASGTRDECAECSRVNPELDGFGAAFGEGGHNQEKFVRNGLFFFSEMGNQHLFHSQTCKKNNRFVGFYQIPFKLLVKNESTQLAAFYFYCANRQGPLSRIKFLSIGSKMSIGRLFPFWH